MTAAPPDSKQHLTCENRAPAHDRWAAAPEGSAGGDFVRLQQRLERAEREARAARGWAWMMFGLAITSGLAVSLLAARLGERQVDEKNVQALLDVLSARSRHDLQQIPAPAPALPPASALIPPARPAAAPTATDQAVDPSAAGHSHAPAAPSLPPTVGPRQPTREIPTLPPAARGFAIQALPQSPGMSHPSPVSLPAKAHQKPGQPARLQGKPAASAAKPPAAPQRAAHPSTSIRGRSARSRARWTTARTGRYTSWSTHGYSVWRGGWRHYRRAWHGGRHYRHARRYTRGHFRLAGWRRGHAGSAHWSQTARRHHFGRRHYRTSGHHGRGRVSFRAWSAGSDRGGRRQ